MKTIYFSLHFSIFLFVGQVKPAGGGFEPTALKIKKEDKITFFKYDIKLKISCTYYMDLILPKISVIVPVYNVENYISKCLESIINQTYKNLEIIIVDDGSTDKSRDICEYYEKKDNRIVLIHHENQGLSMARNTGLDIVSGSYIGFVDSNDWIALDMYQTLYGNAIAYDADISMCNFYYVSQNGKTFPYSNENDDTKVLEGVYKIAHNIRLSNNWVWNRLYKRYLFNDIRFPKGKLFGDVFVMHKLVDTANKVVLSSCCKYYYLGRENGITLSSFNINQMDNVEAYIERYNYISGKYPALEKTCRKFIFSGLLSGMSKAYIDNRIESNKEALIKIINKAKSYDFLDCALSLEENNLLKLLFKDIQSYIIGMRLSAQHNKSKEISENTEETEENVEEINWFLENESFNTNIAVSVIIPIYNVEHYLRQCLDSIITQTLTNIEIICINDGSPDNSLEILKEYEKKDNRVIIISRENKGVAVSRNEGIQMAKGEFVIFMDPDDWYPSKLNLMELYSCAKKNDALICGGSLSRYLNSKTIYGESENMFDKKGFFEYKDYQYSYYFQRFIFSREMLLNNNIFFPQYINYEDPPFMVKAMITAKKFYAIKSIVYRYRTDYKTANSNDDKIADMFKGLKDCLILSSANHLSKLHTFTANILFGEYWPLASNLLFDTGRLHRLLFELLYAIDYKIVNKDFITRVLDFFGQEDDKYLSYIKKDKIYYFSVFDAYEKCLHERNIYPYLKDDFNLISAKEKNNNLLY